MTKPHKRNAKKLALTAGFFLVAILSENATLQSQIAFVVNFFWLWDY